MTDDGPQPTQDTRKTSAEKLTVLREIANEMLRVAAREPNDKEMQKLAWYGEKMQRVLDGNFV